MTIIVAPGSLHEMMTSNMGGARMRLWILALLLVPWQSNAASKANIYIVGSIHDLHKSDNFTESKFEGILKKISPDEILIEFPTDWFDSGGSPNAQTKASLEDQRNKDGRRDGQLAWQYCQMRKIPCRPFDIEKRNEFFRKTNAFAGLEEFEKELNAYSKNDSAMAKALAGTQSLYETCLEQSPEILNNRVCDEAIKLKEDLAFELYRKAKAANKLRDPEFYETQNDFWTRRNKAMADNICGAAKKMHGQKVLVITGADHRYFLLGLLKKCESANLADWS